MTDGQNIEEKSIISLYYPKNKKKSRFPTGESLFAAVAASSVALSSWVESSAQLLQDVERDLQGAPCNSTVAGKPFHVLELRVRGSQSDRGDAASRCYGAVYDGERHEVLHATSHVMTLELCQHSRASGGYDMA